MAINKNVAAIVVAFITGLSPMGVILTQNIMEQKKMEAGIIDTSVLLNHSLFTHADTWVELIIPGLQVSDTARQFLTIKFVAFQEALEDLVKNSDFDSMTDNQLSQVVSRNLNNTVTSYIAEARQAGISEEFISSFSLWHQKVVDILVQSIGDNVYSIIHTTQNSKMYAILTAYDAALGATIGDVEKTLETHSS
jgi:hypothetical protein|tara:strand:+ start:1321 stop:1902 length:582 start_codon:yes stop_codon:yes gene_type:complete